MTTPGEDLHADLDNSWLLPPAAAREAVHTRSIVCRSFRRDDGLLEVDARFIDTRPFAYASEFRGECAPGAALHNLQLRVTVDRTRHVVALVSAMPGTPAYFREPIQFSSCQGDPTPSRRKPVPRASAYPSTSASSDMKTSGVFWNACR